MKIKTIACLAGLALAAAPSAANDFKSMAKELSAAARRGRVERVAVLPFVAGDGTPSRDGWNISERLLTQLVLAGKVQTLERSMLRQLLDEHHLGETGLMDPASVKKLGAVLSADGLVAGSYVTVGDRVLVDARLIDVQSGVILGACEREIDRDDLGETADAPPARDSRIFVPVPELNVQPPTIEPEEMVALKDSVSDDASCDDAAARVDRYEESILDLKARYWALQLKKGLAASSLKINPGSTISDPALRQRFYAMVKDWYAQQRIPELSSTETMKFVAIDSRAFTLYRQCGI